MQTIILAAGNNERFDGVHKSSLPAPDGRTFLENQVEAFDADPIFYIAQKKYAEELREIVHKCTFMDGTARTLLHAWLEKPTTGPLDSLYKAKSVLEFLEEDNPVLIAYCDVLPPENYVKEFIESCRMRTAGIIVFKSEDERFQDAITDSGLKNSGLFYFGSAKLLKDSLYKTSKRGPENGIPDLIYKTKNPTLFICEDIVDIGTPEAYKEWIDDISP